MTPELEHQLAVERLTIEARDRRQRVAARRDRTVQTLESLDASLAEIDAELEQLAAGQIPGATDETPPPARTTAKAGQAKASAASKSPGGD